MNHQFALSRYGLYLAWLVKQVVADGTDMLSVYVLPRKRKIAPCVVETATKFGQNIMAIYSCLIQKLMDSLEVMRLFF